MNARAGLALVRHTWSSWMASRSFFFILAFGWMVPPLIYLFAWSVAAGEGAIGGMTRDGLVTYYLALIVVNQITYSQSNWTAGELIADGSLNGLLLRPMPPVYNTLAMEVAGKVVYLAFTVPVTVLLALALRPAVRWTWGDVAMFVPALALAWALRFTWGYWLAQLYFWATRADALLSVQDALVFLLAGQVAPVQLLPGAVRTAATALPFRYMLGFPVEVLNGQLAPSQVVQGFAVGGGWLVLSLALSVALWRMGLRRLFIGPGLDSLAGITGDLWTGRLDFTLLRPVNTQFLVTFREWRFLALIDLAVGAGVVAYGVRGASPGRLGVVSRGSAEIRQRFELDRCGCPKLLRGPR